MAIQKAECGITVGDIMSSDHPLGRCPALRTEPATGIKFLQELGMPARERTQLVSTIYQLQCDGARGKIKDIEPFCLYDEQQAVAEIVEMAKAGFEPDLLREAIDDLSRNFRSAAFMAVGDYLFPRQR
ncbi:hypothetical protein ISS86_00185 [Candidatus Microgenomates bacterium]|nr:hypothetical protein [Candidatus Microgenomates bacterium]